MKKIEVVTENTYCLSARGHDMTLERTGDGGWRMTTHNASSRAYSGGMGGVRYFDTVGDVEAAYKSWAGVGELVAQEQTRAALYRAKNRCHAGHYTGKEWQAFKDRGRE